MEGLSGKGRDARPAGAEGSRPVEAQTRGAVGRTPRDSAVEMREIVLPSDANALGAVLGGKVMHLMDLAAAMAAQRLVLDPNKEHDAAQQVEHRPHHQQGLQHGQRSCSGSAAHER